MDAPFCTKMHHFEQVDTLSFVKTQSELDSDLSGGEVVCFQNAGWFGTAARKEITMGLQGYGSQTHFLGATHFQSQSNDLFRQPAASRIDDVSHRCVEMKPNVQMGSAWKKQVASPGCLSQANPGIRSV